QRLEEERGGPGVVEEGLDPARLGRGDDRRHVLDLEGERARALHIDERGVVADEAGDADADQRVVERRLDAEALEEGGAKIAHWAVDGIDHEDVVAGFDESEDRRKAGRGARAEGDGAM